MTGRRAFVVRRAAGIVPLAALVGACALSLVVLGAAVLAPVLPGDAASAPAGPDADRARPFPVPEAPTFVAEALVSKPLFSPTRSPPQPAPAPVVETAAVFVPPPPPEEPRPNYSLRGIVATPTVRKALLGRDEDGKPAWLAESERSREGWVLSRVTLDDVLLSKGSREITLHLKPKRASKPQFATR